MPANWRHGRRRSWTSCRRSAELRDVASDQQNGGLQADLVIDRDTASRLGITPQVIDDTLYDAFGQRQVSTIFTQLNQYHVVLEVDPAVPAGPDRPDEYLCAVAAQAAQVPLDALSRTSSRLERRRSPSTTRDNFRW